MAFSKVILNGTTLMDVTGDTVVADKLLTGYQATGADGEKVQGSYIVPVTYTLIATQTFTVNTSSTSATSVGSVACGSTAWTSDKILYVKIRDNAGARQGYCIGSDTYIYNRQPANDSTTTLQYAARITHSLRSGNEFYTYPTGTNTGYGVYANTIASDGTLTIYARYNSTYCGTINGTFTVQVYLIDYPVPNGNPYVL